jgi:tetratricopeptide (TPR) repeat protein
MKQLTTVLVVLIALAFIPCIAPAQSAEDYVKDGIESLEMAGDFFLMYAEKAGYFWLGDALDCFNTAIELNPEYAEAYYWRAECYAWLEDYQEEARNDYITAARLGFKPAQDYLREKGIQW